MGRWAQRKRTGGVRHYGTLTAPGDSDWHLTQGDPGKILVHRDVSFPAPATSIAIRDRNITATTWLYEGFYGGTPVTLSGKTTGQTWEVQIAWGKSDIQLSPWTPSKQIVVP